MTSVWLATTAIAVPADVPPQWQLVRIDGSVLESADISVDSGGTVRLANSDVVLSVNDLASVENLAAGELSNNGQSAGRIRLLLAGDGSMVASQLTLDSGEFKLQSNSGTTSLPSEVVRGVIWTDSETVQQALANPSSEQDSVIVQSKDDIRGVQGVLERIDDQFVWLNFRGESRKVGLEKIHAVVMANLGLPLATGNGVNAELIDGGRIAGVLRSWDGAGISLEVTAGTVVTVGEDSLVRLSIDSDRLIYLSDLQPTVAQHRPMFTVDRPWQRDRSVNGGTLMLADRETGKKITYAKGLGTSSWSRLVFENDRDFDRLAFVAGIDAGANGRGNCRMVVRGDGIELWSEEVSGQMSAMPVEIDIHGMRTIELEVQPGKNFDLADFANWCNARFLISK